MHIRPFVRPFFCVSHVVVAYRNSCTLNRMSFHHSSVHCVEWHNKVLLDNGVFQNVLCYI
ncbi:hypothetical protein T4D_2791 [Trichinella pseudospiralis]|uniref:Uncharacterized protein n=1 Tax=Trichinella pseudospiralis TaxID=6337 RepID=A0A0V1FVS0_TRIPS|nr:hypothetical protein T4D_2791 [Trichinella pseudospiralis]